MRGFLPASVCHCNMHASQVLPARTRVPSVHTISAPFFLFHSFLCNMYALKIHGRLAAWVKVQLSGRFRTKAQVLPLQRIPVNPARSRRHIRSLNPHERLGTTRWIFLRSGNLCSIRREVCTAHYFAAIIRIRSQSL